MTVAVRKVLQKRVPTSIEYRYKITNYGSDNLYPQTVEQIAFRSPIVESALDALTDFTFGEGFAENGDLIVNRYEQTLNDILAEITPDYAPNNGWALHFNVNALGLITEILPVKFKTVRFGLPDEDGRHYDVKYSANWDAEQCGTILRADQIETFPIWNKRGEEVIDVENSRGYIHYWTPEMDAYPKASFDSVLDSAQTNGEIQVFELGSIQNSFLGTSVFKHYGKFASEKEKGRLLEDLGELTGAENAGAVFVVEVPQNFDGEIIENLPANNSDQLFNSTNTNVINRITARFGVPYPLLGIQPTGGGIFNEQQLKDSYDYYNNRTNRRRKILAKEFDKFLVFWAGGSVQTGGILENQFELTNTPNDGE